MAPRNNAIMVPPRDIFSRLRSNATSIKLLASVAPMLSYNCEFAYIAVGEYLPRARAGVPTRSAMKFVRVVCAGALLLAGRAPAQQGGQPTQKTTISLRTATPGCGFPLHGHAL